MGLTIFQGKFSTLQVNMKNNPWSIVSPCNTVMNLNNVNWLNDLYNEFSKMEWRKFHEIFSCK